MSTVRHVVGGARVDKIRARSMHEGRIHVAAVYDDCFAHISL